MLGNINESNIKISMKLNEFKMFAILKIFRLLGEENQNNSFKLFFFHVSKPSEIPCSHGGGQSCKDFARQLNPTTLIQTVHLNV